MPSPRLPPPRPDGWRHARVLVVVAHPDDEVLGCGALLASLNDARIVHVTDGAPADGADAAKSGFATPAAYADARHREALEALALAGVAPERLIRLRIADQAVPAHLGHVARALAPLVADSDVVLTHAFEGGHGDHDAVAFATHAAHRLSGSAAALVEMPFYHGDATGWVRQRFLPRDETENHETVQTLSPAERDLKTRMLAAHASQGDTLRDFPVEAERFRVAEPTDFARRPHDGPLLYERHGWSLSWPAWVAHVEAACRELGLDLRS